jgi:xylulokinase
MHGGIERADMTRAVIEGVSFALRDSLELMKELGVNPEEAVAVGGGASSAFWLQVLSDVTNLPLRTVSPPEGAPLGAAMLAAVGVGAFTDAAGVGVAWLTDLESVTPNTVFRDTYDDAYGRYRELYAALKKMFATTANS